jgi:glycosyltransferase involved in cell wall biosynthesis
VTPTVSVVIPTFRRPALLAEALASVAAQTRAPLEVIVADNDAAGSAAAVVERAASSGLAARWMDASARSGASAARNAGASAARGEYLAFLDDDDRWEPTYLSTALDLVERTGALLVLTAILRRDSNGREWAGKLPPAIISVRDVLRGNPGVVGSNTFVRRDEFTRLGGYDEALPASEDRDLLVRLLAAGASHAVCAERLVVQYEHGSSRLTQQGSLALLEGRRRFYRKHRRAMPWSLRRALLADMHYAAFRTLRERERWGHGLAGLALGDLRAARDVLRSIFRP